MESEPKPKPINQTNGSDAKSVTISFSRSTLTKWLAYLVGGLVVVTNASLVAPAFSLLGNEQNQFGTACNTLSGVLAANADCISPGQLIRLLLIVFLPVALVLVGLCIVLFKRRFLSQAAAILTGGLLVVELWPYFNQYASGFSSTSLSYSSPVLSPQIQALAILLVATIAGSEFLSEPGLTAKIPNPPGTPKWLANWLDLKMSRANIKWVAIIFVAVVLIAIALVYGLKKYQADSHDAKLVANFPVVQQKIMSGIKSAASTIKDPQGAWSWRGAAASDAYQYGITLASGSDNYELCGTFETDKSGGKLSSGPFSPADEAHHQLGYQCFTYPVDASIAYVKDTKIDKDELVVNNDLYSATGKNSPTQIQMDSLGTGAGDLTITFRNDQVMLPSGAVGTQKVEVQLPNGASGTPADIKLGAVIDAYFETNVLSASQSVYKVVVTNAGPAQQYCTIIDLGTGGFPATPNPICPDTVNNLKISYVSTSQLSVQTTKGLPEHIKWPTGSVPSVTGVDGSSVSLEALTVGDTVSLVYTNGVMSGIKMLTVSAGN